MAFTCSPSCDHPIHPEHDPRRAARPGKREYTLHDGKVPGLGLRARPTGAKAWVLYLGTRKLTLDPADRLDLDAARRNVLALIAGEALPPLPISATSPTFDALADAFLAAKTGKYKEETLASTRIYLNTQLRPAFGQRPVLRIITPEVAQWFHVYSRTRS